MIITDKKKQAVAFSKIHDPRRSPDGVKMTKTAGLTIKDRLQRYSRGGYVIVSPQALIIDLLSGDLPPRSVRGVYLLSIDELVSRSDSTVSFCIKVLLLSKRKDFFVISTTQRPEALARDIRMACGNIGMVGMSGLELWMNWRNEVQNEMKDGLYAEEIVVPRVESEVSLVALNASARDALCKFLDSICPRQYDLIFRRAKCGIAFTQAHLQEHNFILELIEECYLEVKRLGLMNPSMEVRKMFQEGGEMYKIMNDGIGKYMYDSTHGCAYEGVKEGGWKGRVMRVVKDVKAIQKKEEVYYPLVKAIHYLCDAVDVSLSWESRERIEYLIWLTTFYSPDIPWCTSEKGINVLERATQGCYEIANEGGEMVVKRTIGVGGGVKVRELQRVVQSAKDELPRRMQKRARGEKKKKEKGEGEGDTTHDGKNKAWWRKDWCGGAYLLIVCEDKSEELCKAVACGNYQGYQDKVWLRFLERKTESFSGRKMTTLSDEQKMWMAEEGRVRNKLFAKGADSWHGAKDDAGCAEKISTLSSCSSAPLTLVTTYTRMNDYDALLFLRDMAPQYVVMYDVRLEFVRTLEAYGSELAAGWDGDLNKHEKVRVTAIQVEGSRSENNYSRSVEKENAAFEKLIDAKLTMAVGKNSNMTQEMEMAVEQGCAVSSFKGPDGKLYPLSADTRKGRGLGASNAERTVAVDVREFKSQLPSVLFSQGFRLAPITLSVGDYVITKQYCVERKAHGPKSSDLRESLKNGRLLSQCEAMEKYYPKGSVLLIECNEDVDKGIEFGLCTAYEDMHGDITAASIIAKLAVLIMRFPLLRIMWAKTPAHAAELFAELKQQRGQDAVDIDKAKEFGSNDLLDKNLLTKTGGKEAYGQGGEEDEDEDGNETAKRILLKLPGVTTQNARAIMEKAKNLQELSNFSKAELKPLVGLHASEKLWNFFNCEVDFDEMQRLQQKQSQRGRGKGGRYGKRMKT